MCQNRFARNNNEQRFFHFSKKNFLKEQRYCQHASTFIKINLILTRCDTIMFCFTVDIILRLAIIYTQVPTIQAT